MRYEERALVFENGGNNLYGILSAPDQAASRGVVMVVGGPQYRAGSHRQFVLLARHLASLGVPVLRFDYGGMGDSDGPVQSFEQAGDDLRAAIDLFCGALPAVGEVVLWGLCDAASAILSYGYRDGRVAGMVLLNPWARTETGLARATLKHYYLRRLFDRSLWQKIAGGRFDLRASLRSVFQLAGAATRNDARQTGGHSGQGAASLPERMYQGLDRFGGAVLFICSSADLTAREFTDLASSSKKWRQLMGRRCISMHTLAGADHTFSRAEWRDQVASWTAQWLMSPLRQGRD